MPFCSACVFYDHRILLPGNSGEETGTEAVWQIFTITIGANLFYLLWEILLAVEKRENIKRALLARFEKRVPEDFILWNFSPLSPHLWYLQALLYVLVIAFIVEHLGLRKLAYLAIPVLLAGSLIKGSYSLFFVGKEDCHIYYARNFLY